MPLTYGGRPCRASQSRFCRSAPIFLKDIRFFTFAPEVMVSGVKAIISRTGYTGEDGFEIYVPAERFPWSGNPSLKRVPQRVWCR